jgi:chromate reductase
MGASMGAMGTARMQYHLRQVLVFVDARTLARPEVMIGQAQNLFDAQGRLTDDKTRKSIAGLLEAFASWIRQLQHGATRA